MNLTCYYPVQGSEGIAYDRSRLVGLSKDYGLPSGSPDTAAGLQWRVSYRFHCETRL